jgi:hypothetical protein
MFLAYWMILVNSFPWLAPSNKSNQVFGTSSNLVSTTCSFESPIVSLFSAIPFFKSSSASPNLAAKSVKMLAVAQCVRFFLQGELTEYNETFDLDLHADDLEPVLEAGDGVTRAVVV